ncbi:MAG: 16S rRNA (uracil(1498)-N(3))-methyltransferase [Bacteroidales bacterium]|jgi:16S rRNA (uracil1498-N3)-methyltransferase
MHLFYSPVVTQGPNLLGEQESWHCTRVLRLGEGGKIHLTDGHGNLYECVIQNADSKKCIVNVISIKTEYLKRKNYLHIGIAPTKSMDRFEWFLEKATEIGINEITPVFCAHSERIRIKTERLQKILVSAMKQSLKAYLPILNEPVDLRKLLSKDYPGQKFIGYCESGEEDELQKVYQQGANALILIGPEGDFSPEEILLAKKEGFIPISLGKSRLRTETAGIVACHTIMMMNS